MLKSAEINQIPENLYFATKFGHLDSRFLLSSMKIKPTPLRSFGTRFDPVSKLTYFHSLILKGLLGILSYFLHSR